MLTENFFKLKNVRAKKWGWKNRGITVQSDNGTEFVNDLRMRFPRASGFEDRLVVSYHPRANGVADRRLQTTVLGIKNAIKGASKDWDVYEPCVQLATNAKVYQRHKIPPFAPIVSRQLNHFKDYREDKEIPPMTEEELEKQPTKWRK